MKMDESHRAETGAFYTPKPWAGKAVECFRALTALRFTTLRPVKARFLTRCPKGRIASALFLLRIAEELHPVLTCSFTKLDIYQSPNMGRFRSRFGVFQRHLDGFICPSMAWPGLKGKFPIAFSVFASF